MEKYPQRQELPTAGLFSASQKRHWLAVAAALLIATVLGFGYGYREHDRANQLASQANRMSATIDQLQAEMNRLNAKLNESISAPAGRPAEEWLSEHPKLQDTLLRRLQRKQFDGAIVVQSQ